MLAGLRRTTSSSRARSSGWRSSRGWSGTAGRTPSPRGYALTQRKEAWLPATSRKSLPPALSSQPQLASLSGQPPSPYRRRPSILRLRSLSDLHATVDGLEPQPASALADRRPHAPWIHATLQRDGEIR